MDQLEQAVDKILSSRRITRYDQNLLMAILTQKHLSPRDADMINRVYEALSQGRLRVVD